MSNLNPQQKEAVEIVDGYVLVLSAAGTGKTTVLVERFLYLLSQNISPYNILCVTFTNKAAHEMIKRIHNRLPEHSHLWIGTFHSVCFRMLQISGIFNGNIIDDFDARKICDSLGIDVNLIEKEGEERTKYLEYLETYNYIDFDGILSKTLQHIEFLKTKFGFGYIMIDEYQDTNEIQEKIISALGTNLYCVGDDDQSIYSWRGSCLENILHFKVRYPTAKICYLTKNYRCTTSIVKVANSIILQNKQRHFKEMEAESKITTPITICYTKNEGEFIAKTINMLPKNVSIAILFRQNSHMNTVETELMKYGISYSILGGRQFFSYPEIKLAIAYCKALFAGDVLSLELMLQKPKKGIGTSGYRKILSYISQYKEEYPEASFSFMLVKALQNMKQYEYASDIESWINVPLPAKELFLKIWKESGCEDLYPQNSNITILASKIGEFESISKFCENYFSLDLEEQKNVSLLTIHLSKGLEFDYVFIPFMIDGTFPNYRSFENLEEERRIAYVAITRARMKLYFSYSLSFYKSKISRFLLGLPKIYISSMIF